MLRLKEATLADRYIIHYYLQEGGEPYGYDRLLLMKGLGI